MMAAWRPMASVDLTAVTGIAAEVHPDYPESAAVFAERLRLYPLGCWMADAAGGALGYAIAHPNRLGEPPPLDSLLGALPKGADCLYLHDVSLLPAARGLGLGTAVLATLRVLAEREGLARLALTSTPVARAYWERQGFRDWSDGTGRLEAKLVSYGEGMAYMTSSVR